MNRVLLLLLAFALALGAPTGCQKAADNRFQVVFDSPPAIVEEGVYLNGTAIGTVVESEPGIARAVRLTLEIDPARIGEMRTNRVLCASAGRLELVSLEPVGEPLPPGSTLLGFPSRSGLFWFKARTLLDRRSLAAAREAENLVSRFP